ncbi:MAG TPA: quinohemoprotein amine dehydrogenase subunit alpha [Alphaproteobacteria bacterium]
MSVRDWAFGWLVGAVALIALVLSTDGVRAADGEAILNARCGACHVDEGDGLSRIKGQRKTPEGWLMTIVRMGIMHGVEVPADERRALVKYLADSQGLAPSETTGYRYILEREPAQIEDFPPEYFYMCARCHSGARGALQRRTKDEWRWHIDFHLGQWPTTEYQFYGRDREWYRIASTETVDWLYEHYPFDSQAWQDWKGHSVEMSGDWRWVGRGPGVGFHNGITTFSATGEDTYSASDSEFNLDGSAVEASGSAIIYTGYELRARLTEATSGDEYLSIAALSEDGNRAEGRFMLSAHDETGAHFVAVRMRDGHSEIMAVEPAHIRAGSEAEIAIHGTGLNGAVDLGAGVEVVNTVSSGSTMVVVNAKAAADAALGARAIKVGDAASANDALVVYDAVARVAVEPAYAFARVGEGGGTRPDQYALFDAVGFTAGPDGAAGTDDDVRIGVMPATWSVEPFDEVAAELDDVGFAGQMDPKTGIFDPADAGLNPARPFETNNAGNLKVIGTVDDAGNAVAGEGQLLVTVQRWNDPPIR